MTSLTATIAEIIETCIRVHGDFDTWQMERQKDNEASVTFCKLNNFIGFSNILDCGFGILH